jgi:hypothetical protein
VQRLPKPDCLLRAVLWNKSAILMNDTTCLIFHLDQQTIQSRDQFAVRVIHFGLVIENETLFVIGGGTSRNKTWTFADEVKYVPVVHIVNNETMVQWIQHAKLTAPSFHAYSTNTLTLNCQA